MYKLCFLVPEAHVERVKSAVFAAAGSRVGNYDYCAWQTRGQGQFRALAGADPYLGDIGEVKAVAEMKVELVCDERLIGAAVAALKAAHPYETPAYEVYRLEDF